MAKPVSKLGDFKGTIDGITYYTLNGERICRKAAPPSKEQIHNDPRFAAVKQNNNEFGGASAYAKAIRNELAPYLNTFKDTSFNNRLTSCCLKMAKKGRGIPGQRSINAHNLSEALIGIELHNKYEFDKQLKYSPRLQRTAKGIYIDFSGMQPHDLVGTPKFANQFKLIALQITLPEYTWDTSIQKYTPVKPGVAPANTHLTTPPIAISDIPEPLEFYIPIPKNKTHKPIQSNPSPAAHEAKETHILWLGIQYGKQHNGQFIALETGRAMQCIAVY
ncbi:hypothetical protein [Leeuwenhoekiella marinoflava]|uniref:Uncharacterized protein n=2 Tax=Leeuwenhoekiella marinoflava TaxID=988 RepID=A0A4Q0PBN5_9FLAO|nr:hypothetical protein [Leeuwenhoekiella marinoflava]RXG24147.1 hypothetical protein DSL99_3789 [Leeuwenhoekiella marinoflava]SHF98987.1 hypothetical protein SAMN02745246_03928 [Leeuwenhoekiella marinoflava DSM 3653]